MNSMVKEVKERNGASAPVAPSLPSSQTGFPSVQHRSQRISQFKRARGGGSTIYSGSVHLNEPPKVREEGAPSVAGRPLARTPSSGVAETRPSEEVSEGDFQAANEVQVAQMTSSQREREIEELESTISPELLALLRARVAKKVASASNAVASTSSIKVEAPSESEGLSQDARVSIPDEEVISAEQASIGDNSTIRDEVEATKSGASGNFALTRDP